MSVAEIVQEKLEPVVEKLGYELIETEYVKKQNGMNLFLYIDSKNGITLEDCEKVHITVDTLLDEFDPTNGAPYTLNVSSLGLDRPLKTDKDLNRNIGEDIEISLYSKIDGKKSFVGKLVSFTEDDIVIMAPKGEMTINRKQISKINKYITF